MKIYNGENMILGRLASAVAKDALLGEEVRVINCRRIIISGRKVNTYALAKGHWDRKAYPLKSSKFSRMPDRFVRRTIRGMLPWRDTRGREAFRRIMCYNSVPPELVDKNAVSLAHASVKKLPNLKFVTMEQLCHQLGGKIPE